MYKTEEKVEAAKKQGPPIGEVDTSSQTFKTRFIEDHIEDDFDPDASRLPDNDFFEDKKYGEQDFLEEFVDYNLDDDYSLGGVFVGLKILKKTKEFKISDFEYEPDEYDSEDEQSPVLYDPLSIELDEDPSEEEIEEPEERNQPESEKDEEQPVDELEDKIIYLYPIQKTKKVS